MQYLHGPGSADAALGGSLVRILTAMMIVALMLFAGAALAQGPDRDRYIVKFNEGKGQQGLAALIGARAEVLLELAPQNAAAARIPAEALAGLENHPSIEYIEWDPRRYPMAETVPYGVPMVQADPTGMDASRLGPGGNPRMVCIIDSGYDYNHEDLPRHGGILGLDSTGWKTDGCGHGTHVAGTIAAIAGNSKGVVGVFGGNINLYNVKVFGDNCSWSYASSLIDASNKCADAGANIISMSLGCSGGGGGPFACSSSTENNAFQTHYNNGILSVAAAGNDGNTAKSYPASYESVISVAAVDSAKVVATFSQQNNAVELAAPGVAVRSTVPTGTGKEESLTVATSNYEAIALDGSPNADRTGALVDCGLGTATCTAASGGKVCLIARGDISFADKVLNCQAGGGSAAVIYNNAPGLFSGTLGGTATLIPSVGISQEDGQYLKVNALGSSARVFVATGHYAYFDGTSMATPHVSAVAALIWSHNTTWTNADIRAALQNTAEDLGAAGRDNAYGYGLVQAKAAHTLLSGGGGDPPPNSPPIASFTYGCTDLACNFDGSGSSDSDGSISSYSWTFGDGATGSGATVSHTYGADGTYTVELTVTDDDGATGTYSETVTVSSSSGGGGITLSASGYKVRGVQHADLTWSGATSTNVDILRNEAIVTTTANDGAHTDNIGNRGGGSYTYRVCEAGSSTCSNEAVVTF